MSRALALALENQRVVLPGVGAISAGASPYTYKNTSQFPQQVFVSGGTVSAVSFSRDGVAWVPVSSATNAQVWLSPGDSAKVTYSVVPTINVVPR